MTEMKGGVPGGGTGTSGASRGVAASVSGAQKKAVAETRGSHAGHERSCVASPHCTVVLPKKRTT